MTDEQIKDLVDTNFRILFLLGYATSLVMEYKSLNTYHDDEKKCDWFIQSINNVIYLKKPLPELP